ncbi:hypothetical protein R1T08_03025 [Streptomyces sp. SBC-4]|nr:hypothetical protein [Streptomyces sp. SBC-4]MDV5143307.1 hypothetical protein [Streptomyces sp. SBC-4]
MGQDDRGGQRVCPGGQGYGDGVVAGALRDHAAAARRGYVFDGQEGAADLERAAALEVFGLEPQTRAACRVELFGTDDRSAQDSSGQSEQGVVHIGAPELGQGGAGRCVFSRTQAWVSLQGKSGEWDASARGGTHLADGR